MFRHHGFYELFLLGPLLIATVMTGWHLLAAFRASPANFPLPNPKPLRCRP